MKYTDLIFDLYGTLVDIHTDENDLVWEKTALFFGYYGAHRSKAYRFHASVIGSEKLWTARGLFH